MRKLLIGIVPLLMLGTVAVAQPYRSEQIIGVAENNRTGCTIDAYNSSGWLPSRSFWGLRVERFEEPVLAGIAVYECGGKPSWAGGRRPAAMTLLIPGTGYRAEGCLSRDDPGSRYTALPATLPTGGVAQRVRVFVQVRADEPAQIVDMTVSRQIRWRSATFDGLMSV